MQVTYMMSGDGQLIHLQTARVGSLHLVYIEAS